MSKIMVIGSSNYDLMVYTDRFPKPGETIKGNSFEMGFGGKGANQACIAAKLGSEVYMVTRLGEDIFGRETYENYKNLGIHLDFVKFSQGVSSGVAPITVDMHSENSIVIVPGANDLLSYDDVDAALKNIAPNLVILQNEIRPEVTYYALKKAKELGIKTLYNPAPVPTESIPTEIFSAIDILILNETEAATIFNLDENNISAITQALLEIQKHHKCTIILTLGKKGSTYIVDGTVHFIEGISVNAVDTTGAGDCFIGSFAHFFTMGDDMATSLNKASKIAALSVTKRGTQKSYPTRTEADTFLEKF
ncbi:MAG: ribokinase [Fusobacteria bacterium]|nr:ribokinase [Fusobacteriota bacterium]